MKIANTKRFWLVLIIATLQITVSGCFLGYFHKYDLILAVVLLLRVIRKTYTFGYKNKSWYLIFAMLLTAVVGMSIEFTGVYNHLWEYHDLSNNRKIPLWLPFAWMNAFFFLYRMEKEVIKTIANKTPKNKMIIAALICFIYPTYGEMITIYLGVWTYYMPFQILGVPIIAMFALVFIHLCINYVMVRINKKYNLKDEVFTM